MLIFALPFTSILYSHQGEFSRLGPWPACLSANHDAYRPAKNRGKCGILKICTASKESEWGCPLQNCWRTWAGNVEKATYLDSSRRNIFLFVLFLFSFYVVISHMPYVRQHVVFIFMMILMSYGTCGDGFLRRTKESECEKCLGRLMNLEIVWDGSGCF